MNTLRDNKLVKYLLKNEEIILRCFDVPEDETPAQFILQLANRNFTKEEGKDRKAAECIYCLRLLYVTNKTDCVVSRTTFIR